jgi:RNA polymerase sigma-70 factor (ECF subfamily)
MNQPDASVRDEIVDALPRLRRFARTLARNPHDADDLVQIAVERALSRVAQWRPGTSLLSWMFGILRNAWIDETRSRNRRDRLFAAEEAADDVGDSAIDRDTQMWSIRAALRQLPEEQRSAVALVLIEGLSYKEAAHALEIPIGTLTSRLARGREKLATALEEHR